MFELYKENLLFEDFMKLIKDDIIKLFTIIPNTQKMNFLKVKLDSILDIVLLQCNTLGSQTISLVSRIQKWIISKNQNATSSNIISTNKYFFKLNELYEQVYSLLFGDYNYSFDKNVILRKINQEILDILAELTKYSEVEIFPESIQTLIDEINKNQNIYFCNISGGNNYLAGGYDCIFVIGQKGSLINSLTSIIDKYKLSIIDTEVGDFQTTLGFFQNIS